MSFVTLTPKDLPVRYGHPIEVAPIMHPIDPTDTLLYYFPIPRSLRNGLTAREALLRSWLLASRRVTRLKPIAADVVIVGIADNKVVAMFQLADIVPATTGSRFDLVLGHEITTFGGMRPGDRSPLKSNRRPGQLTDAHGRKVKI